MIVCCLTFQIIIIVFSLNCQKEVASKFRGLLINVNECHFLFFYKKNNYGELKKINSQT